MAGCSLGGTVVIVGAGVAGVSVARELRRARFAGPIRMISSERWFPYNRPPLSKDALTNSSWSPRSCRLRFDPAALGVDLRQGVVATSLEESALVTTAGRLPFDVLVVATGASPVNPWGGSVHTLRNLDDALRLKRELRPGRGVVIVGASWLGCEIASAAVACGCATALIEQAERPVSLLPAEVGSRIASWIEAEGIELRCGARVNAVGARSVILDGGEALRADVVVAAVGVAADTSWLPAGLRGAIEVDEDLRTAAPNVFAVGDAARWPCTGSQTAAAGHWTTAQVGAQKLVAGVTTGPTPAPYVPYFWSKCFGHLVQLSIPGAGRSDCGYEEITISGDGVLAVWDTVSGRQAVLGIDCPREFLRARRRTSVAT